MKAKQQLEVLINSWKMIKERGCLTEKGYGYLEGLERAFAILGAAE